MMVVALFNDLELALHDEHKLEYLEDKWHLTHNGSSVCKGTTLYRLAVHYYFDNAQAALKRKIAKGEVKPEVIPTAPVTQQGLF